MPSLQIFYLQSVNLEAIDGLTFSKLDSLEGLYIMSKTIKKLPVLNLNKLCYFNLNGDYSYDEENPNQLGDISALSLWNCPSLTSISFDYQNIKKLPRINLPSL